MITLTAFSIIFYGHAPSRSVFPPPQLCGAGYQEMGPIARQGSGTLPLSLLKPVVNAWLLLMSGQEYGFVGPENHTFLRSLWGHRFWHGMYVELGSPSAAHGPAPIKGTWAPFPELPDSWDGATAAVGWWVWQSLAMPHSSGDTSLSFLWCPVEQPGTQGFWIRYTWDRHNKESEALRGKGSGHQFSNLIVFILGLHFGPGSLGFLRRALWYEYFWIYCQNWELLAESLSLDFYHCLYAKHVQVDVMIRKGA